MSLVISDEIVRASGLSEDELLEIVRASGLSGDEQLLELVLLLFQQDKISLGKAAELLKMPQIRFQRLLADRHICVHYDVAEFQEDLKHLTAKGWL